ncbi:unnamed protein product, partial [Clonostachys rhizophaga]
IGITQSVCKKYAIGTHQHHELNKSNTTGGASVTHKPTNPDAERQEHFGIQNELRRDYSLPSLVGLCLCLMGTWEASSAVLTQALLSGGAPCLFYNFILTFLCTLAIGASLAEIASIYPTAGGQYYWVTALAPRSVKKLAGWTTGWTSLGGQIVLTASPAFISGLMVQGLINLNDDTYVGTRWQGMLFYWAFVIYAAVMNVWGHRYTVTGSHHSLYSVSDTDTGVLHVGCFVIAFVVLATMSRKNSAGFVSTKVSDQTGWPNGGIAWMVGLISTIYPFLGYDTTCHLAEEVPHAARNVPVAIVGSITINGLMGLASATMLSFFFGSLEDILATLTGFAFMQLS